MGIGSGLGSMSHEVLKASLREITALARELGILHLKTDGIEIQLNPNWVDPSLRQDSVTFDHGKEDEPVLPKHLQSMPSDDKMLLWSTDEDLETNPNEPPRIGDEP